MRGTQDLLSALTAGASFGKANFWAEKQNTPSSSFLRSQAASCGVSLLHQSGGVESAPPTASHTKYLSAYRKGREEDLGEVFPASSRSHGFPPAELLRADVDKASGDAGGVLSAPTPG